MILVLNLILSYFEDKIHAWIWLFTTLCLLICLVRCARCCLCLSWVCLPVKFFPRGGFWVENFAALLHYFKGLFGIKDAIIYSRVNYVTQGGSLVNYKVQDVVDANNVPLGGTFPVSLFNPEERFGRYSFRHDKLDSSHLFESFLKTDCDQLSPQFLIIGSFLIEFRLVKKVHDGLFHGKIVLRLQKRLSDGLRNFNVLETVIRLVNVAVKLVCHFSIKI